MNLKLLGGRIKTRRECRHLRQIDIANALQISSQAVSKWERGENAPDISVLVGLARLLDVSVEWLLGGTSAETDTFPAVVMCTSLNGFATKAATMPPRDVATWANGIYYTLTEAMMRRDGVPIKYVGDGSLGFFAGNQRAERAVDAAKEARRRLSAEELVISLHAGDIYLGRMGHPDYATTDIIGETVNSAFLLMPAIAQHCASGIGISETVCKQLHDGRVLIERDRVTVSGVRSSIILFEPEMD